MSKGKNKKWKYFTEDWSGPIRSIQDRYSLWLLNRSDADIVNTSLATRFISDNGKTEFTLIVTWRIKEESD